ncbi:MAG TPA: Crp/Fnr family transcriptional regulator [Pyrinomonadaceae bacterium]|jgi:CRP/FNR family transcriptional regulator|nr:Crp/Fnr family transcriptional regulator [Pyrinomonadaceae bacterium]
MTIDKISALKRTRLFEELDSNTLRLLAERALERRFQKDEVLFVAGEEAQGLYVIVAGAVRAFRVSLDGREQVIHVERAGATIAELPVFDEGAYPSTAAAEEDTTVLFIDKHDVRQLCLEHPKITLAALKVLAGRLRRCAELVEALSLREVGQRLARFLLAEARRSGSRAEDGIRINLTQTNQQIASRIGSVREVVSRAFTRLQHEGLIIVDGRNLTIPDQAALETFAGES